MSSGEDRRVSPKDIQRQDISELELRSAACPDLQNISEPGAGFIVVQNLIEGCLQLYMSQKDVVNTLLDQEKIEPRFTELVWQKLEEENQDFFKAYYLRLIVKEQIVEFNKLLERQLELMRQRVPAGVASIPLSNGSHIPPMHQNSACYAPENTGPALKPENMRQPIDNTLSNAFTNCGSSMHLCMPPAVDVSAHARRFNVSPSMLLAQSSNVAMIQEMNGGMLKAEAGYAGGSSYIFGANGNVLETRSSIGDAAVSSFSSGESNSHPLNDTLLDADTSSFGFFGPRSFSLSDLTADFSNSSDILESYLRSPFIGSETDNFLDPHGRGNHQGDNKRLDTISEGLNYEDFGSD